MEPELEAQLAEVRALVDRQGLAMLDIAQDRDEARALLRESDRDHRRCEDNCCTSACAGQPVPCDCGAEAWNAKVVAFLRRTEA